ncbi:LOW QUALITY PROTEIN: disintegrin and metalloproteinase domain-containing protein 18-like [Phaenicophaeus curvirostris]|uniref:LOW QUALITY PROTEIN: disintegrin and metalloproteinase domain-containing protein 18-like n=1 Tax=Phaenicophaeus curvirostris TaxID=33595 RepID=UPI0037F0DF30
MGLRWVLLLLLLLCSQALAQLTIPQRLPENTTGEPLLSAEAPSSKYFQAYVVLDKALYDYMGSDRNAATQKMIQVFSSVSTLFNPLNVTIVLSSLELWTEENKISTAGEASDLLQRFVQWKRSHLTQQPHDIAYLLVYRDQAALVGAAAPGKACQRDAAGAVALYQGTVTLESFSILLAQLLGRSLGMSSDSRGCRCPRPICLMSPQALHFSGAKPFSTCNVRDFETFLKRSAGACLFRTARMPRLGYQRAAVCGNGVVEPGEQCDCGTAWACLKDECCTRTCQFKPGVKCSSGLCCNHCQFRPRNTPCRPAADVQCDLPEFCNGSSASCPLDLYVQDGHSCERSTGYCYKGRCQSPDLHCQRLFGPGSQNAPVTCYEEVNIQRDRFGHCGFQPRQGYRACKWRNLRCGKLICTYPSRTPFASSTAAVLYVKVRQHLCVSLHYLNMPARLDPLLVPPGTRCGAGKVCINNTCQPHSVLGYDCNPAVMCHGHGVCNNRRHCHCHPGWKPPDCRQWGSPVGGSIDSHLRLMDGGQCLRGTVLGWVPGAGTEGDPTLRFVSFQSSPSRMRWWSSRCFGWDWAPASSFVLAGATCLFLRYLGLCPRCWWQPPRTQGPTAEKGGNNSEPDPEPELDPDPGTDPDQEPDPEVDLEMDPELGTDPELDLELASDLEPEWASGLWRRC